MSVTKEEALAEAKKKDGSAVVKEAEAAAKIPQKVCEEGDPGMKPDKIVVPVDPINKKDTDITVGLNGKLYKIQRGVPVMVPHAVVEIIENAQAQNAAAMAYIVDKSGV